MTPTATEKKPSASAQLARLERARDKSYAPIPDLKRDRSAWDDETQAMRAALSDRVRTHREEFDGANAVAKPDTEAAKLTAAIKKRLAGPNPKQAELDDAVTEFHVHDEALRVFKQQSIRDRIAEVQAVAGQAVDGMRESIVAFRAASEQYLAAADEVRAVVSSTEGFTGQDCGHDGRVGEWHRLADEVLDSEIGLPDLSPLGHHKADRHV